MNNLKNITYITTQVKKTLHETNNKYKKKGKFQNIKYFLCEIIELIKKNNSSSLYLNKLKCIEFTVNHYLIIGQYTLLYNEVHNLYKNIFIESLNYNDEDYFSIIIFFQSLLKYISDIGK